MLLTARRCRWLTKKAPAGERGPFFVKGGDVRYPPFYSGAPLILAPQHRTSNEFPGISERSALERYSILRAHLRHQALVDELLSERYGPLDDGDNLETLNDGDA
ncbi:MAG: hypothetical protein ABR529_15855 [Actinomycetota bacterium]